MQVALPAARMGGATGVVLGLLCVLACSASPDVPNDFTPPTGTTRSPPSASTEPALSGADASLTDSPGCRTVAPSHRCGLEPQCGCAPSETCEITNRATGAVSCVAAGGTTLGRPCTQTSDCLAGLTCQFGACRPYCTNARTKCNVGGTDLCVEVLDEGGKAQPNMALCTITCDPRDPAPVCGTNACLWFATYYAPNQISDCNAAGTAQVLHGCKTDADCAPGLACADHPGKDIGLECERWCRIGVPGDCPAGFKCNDVFGANAPVIDGKKEGLCQDG